MKTYDNLMKKVMCTILFVFMSLSAVSIGFGWVSAPNNVGVVGGVSLLLAIAVAWYFYVTRYLMKGGSEMSQKSGNKWDMKNFVLIGALFLVMFNTGCSRVDPGHAGIKVNYYGQDKGVQSYPLVTGMVWYNLITETVFQYPTFVQTAVWTANIQEGSKQNEEISFNSKEGLVINGDISLSYQLDAQKVPAFYVKFRSDDLSGFTHGFLRNIARDAFNEEAAKYAVDELYGAKKEEFLIAVRKRINDKVSSFGVEIQQFGFIGAPRLPQNVVDALNMKIKATQDAIRVENELRSAKGEAQKVIAKAEGEARSNEILTKSITPTLLEWKRLELMRDKWNGALPTVMGNGGIPLLQMPAPIPTQ